MPVYGLAALFTIINAGARSQTWWAGIHEARPKSWGTVALPLSVLPALAATWSVSPDRLFALQGGYLVVALADPAASWVGQWARPRAHGRPSTLPGSLAFAVVTLLVTGPFLTIETAWSWGRVLVVTGAVTVVATLIESTSSRGWDNFFVVMGVLLVLIASQHSSPVQLVGALVAGGAFGGAAYRIGALDGRGAVTGGLFAASLVGLGGMAWVWPGLVFFGLSSALTALVVGDVSSVGPADAPRRTQAQVLANGGVAWGALVVAALAPAEAATVASAGYVAFVGALAAAAADTWATELGSLAPSSPWSLRTGRRVPTGTSGAVSLVGCGAACLGALSVVGTALVVEGAMGAGGVAPALLLVGAGLVGMGTDSIVGAFLQAQYRGPSSEEWVETPPETGAVPARGWAGVGNNVVNLIGTATGALAALVGMGLAG
jgi:uncharacterized membrane protein